MQTFLPYGANFARSAKCLDFRRLGKQRVEVKQIYLALTQDNYGWKHHPAVKMWKGYKKSLIDYGIHICYEWQHRGYKDTLFDYFDDIRCHNCLYDRLPANWLDDVKLIQSHRSNLLRKNPSWYSQFNWNVPDNLPYFWPV